ncbi:MAG: hypothetical protein V9H26_21170 [Verrucomicrobiota bacterium]
MKRIIVLSLIGLVANSLCAADASSKDKVTTAATAVGREGKL